MSHECLATKKFIQRFCLKSTCYWDEYKASKLNLIILDWVNNNSVSLLKISLLIKIREKWYLIDDTKSLAFSTNNCENSLHWLLELGDLLQKSKWHKTLVIQNSFLKDCSRYLKQTTNKIKAKRGSLN